MADDTVHPDRAPEPFQQDPKRRRIGPIPIVEICEEILADLAIERHRAEIDAADDGNVQGLPAGRNLEFPSQQDLREFWLMCVEGQPPARQKRILMEARAIGYLSDQDVQIFLDACGLGAA